MKKSEPITVKRLSEIYRSSYRKLFFMAYAVAGNERGAERALIQTMLSASPGDAEREIIRRAMEVRSEGGESVDFDCLIGGEDENDPLSDALCLMSEEDRRLVMLRCGLRLSVRETAEAVGIAPGRVRRRLERVFSELRASARCAEPERALSRLCVKEMQASELAPDFGTVLRAAENQLSASAEPVKRVRRVRGTVSWISAIAALILLGIMLWVCAILLDYFRQTYQEPESVQVGMITTITEDSDARV